MAGLTTAAPGDASRGLGYLPGLDGLRAVAVVAVVAYHLDVPWAVGGFLGVDLFFVISGYLITSLLVREREVAGRIDLAGFWLRRVRRLVPPVVVMVAATLVATRWWGVPEQWNDVRIDAAASVGYVANWWFVASDQSYFESFLGPSPLRHMWSLAVEEQWYLVWPMAVVAMGALLVGSRRRRVVAVMIITAGTLLSALWMAILYSPTDPSRVYFGTDTRAQQLLIGAALAIALPLVPRVARLLASPGALVTSLAGWLLLAAATPDDAPWLYRGGLLVVSVLCAALVAGVATLTAGPVSAALGSAPMRWLGGRSYGVYLWHWPVIVFVGPPMGIELTGASLAVLQVAVALALAELSYRLVERPARASARPAWRLAVGWTGAGVMVVVAGLVVLAPTERRLPTETALRPAALQASGAGPVLDDVADPASLVSSRPVPPVPTGVDAGPEALANDAPAIIPMAGDSVEPSVDRAETLPRRLLLLGDSTALVAGLHPPEDLDVLDAWSFEMFAQLGCALSPGQTVDVGESTPRWNPQACEGFRGEWGESVDVVDPDVAVVMVGAWEVFDHLVDGERLVHPAPEWIEHVEEAVTVTVDGMAGTDRTIALLELPCMQVVDSGIEVAGARRDDERVASFNSILERVADRSEHTVVLPLGDLLCPNGESARGVDGEHLRYDGVHLTPDGADRFWVWLLDELDGLAR